MASTNVTLAKSQIRATNGILIGANPNTIVTDLVRNYSNWTPIEFGTTVTNYVTDSRNSRFKIDAQTCHIYLDITATIPGTPLEITLSALPFSPESGSVYAGPVFVTGAVATVGQINVNPATSTSTFKVQFNAALPVTEIRIQGEVAYNVFY